LTEDEIISFATSLTGGIPFKESVLSEGRLMYAKINDNQTINILEFFNFLRDNWSKMDN